MRDRTERAVTLDPLKGFFENPFSHRHIFDDEIGLHPCAPAFAPTTVFLQAAKAGFGSARASKRGNSNTIKQTTPNKPAEIRQATV
jgi:hypothetical protein